MKLINQGCFASTSFYSVFVVLKDGTEIQTTVSVSWNEIDDVESISDITIINPEEIPHNVTEEEIEEFIKDEIFEE